MTSLYTLFRRCDVHFAQVGKMEETIVKLLHCSEVKDPTGQILR